ncbi:hypothetical protein KIMH_05250 [Bombiscardovia apis]|uniref:CBU-0592-like domain-containing protein n=1 Tax=Bombiscardovia apis TaxID=2932182 RepID=A0ABN6SFC2_9BIFI|nr:hypothetical protein [Bombiscardovia apis]BDR54414.1 hypothetical protein KIMH_05250 [Bombiscardovia apis]
MPMSVQIVGSAAILVAFVLSQMGKVSNNNPWYLLLNAFGSAILAVDALLKQQWGFLLLEGTWAIVAIAGLITLLVRKLRTTPNSPTPPQAAN